MAGMYGSKEETESLRVLARALELGCTFFDTADAYGPFTNERLVGKALAGRRERVVIGTKFGNIRRDDGSFPGVNGDPASQEVADGAAAAAAAAARAGALATRHQRGPG